MQRDVPDAELSTDFNWCKFHTCPLWEAKIVGELVFSSTVAFTHARAHLWTLISFPWGQTGFFKLLKVNGSLRAVHNRRSCCCRNSARYLKAVREESPPPPQAVLSNKLFKWESCCALNVVWYEVSPRCLLQSDDSWWSSMNHFCVLPPLCCVNDKWTLVSPQVYR